MRAKTGTLNGISALAGWVDPVADGTPLAFAVVTNGVPTNLPVTRLAEKVGIALGAWPAAAPVGDLDPEPVTAGSASSP